MNIIEGYKVYRNLQDILLKAGKHTAYTAELDFVMFNGTDLDSDLLKIQLEVYSKIFSNLF